MIYICTNCLGACFFFIYILITYFHYRLTEMSENMDASMEESCCTDSCDECEDEAGRPTKRLAIHEANVSRYHHEFLELELIGQGEFGGVYKCRHRLDGCVYAIKKSLKPVAGSINE